MDMNEFKDRWETACERRIPYPKRQQLPQPPEKMDGPLQRRCNEVSEILL